MAFTVMVYWLQNEYNNLFKVKDDLKSETE
jgi:hypothetical protein